MIAEIGLEELTGLEMEVMRRQASVYCARDPLGAWKQNHGVLVWVGLDSDGAARLEVVQPFQSPYPLAAEVRSGSPPLPTSPCGSGVPSCCSVLACVFREMWKGNRRREKKDKEGT